MTISTGHLPGTLGSDDDPTAARERAGHAVSPGVAIGAAYVVDRRRVHVPHRHIEPTEVDEEQERVRAAVRRAQAHLEDIKSKLAEGENLQILEAQQLMLGDPHVVGRSDELIRSDLINAEWAVSNAIDEIVETLGKASDEYLRERRFDVTFTGDCILQHMDGEHPGGLVVPAGAVVVAHDLSPADTAQLHRSGAAGIVTEEGGQTSHSAIMARAFEIPSVVGVESIVDQVRTGDIVVVDGIRGQVLIRPRAAKLEEYRAELDRYSAFETKIHKQRALPATTVDGLHVAIRANLALQEEVTNASDHGAEGVGLYRTEFLFMDRDRLPTEDEHYQMAKAVIQRCAPNPVIMRTFDLGADKPCRFFAAAEPEANPAMGVRSLRLALRHREVFLTQVRALLRAGLHGPLRIMLPLISSLSELREGLGVVAEARRQLQDSGRAFAADVPVGIMIEVPSAAIIADILAEHVDFMSIGTNDLIQFTLAIDRESDEVNYLYQPLHPAILRLIRGVCEAGARSGTPVSLCGEMAADPRYTWLLVGLGVRELSMHSAAIPVIKSIVRTSSLADMQALAAAVLETTTAADASKLVTATMQARFPEHIEHGVGGGDETSAA